MNVPSPHPCRHRNGGWWHYYRSDDFTPHTPQQPRPQPPPIIKATPPLADVERAHSVYVDFLRSHLVLADEHRANLRGRGLSDLAIEFHGFKSTPTNIFAANIARALSKDYDLTGVPCFYRERGAWCMNFGAWYRGIIIPVKDTRARIRGLMIRRDALDKPKYVWLSSKDKPDGASPGAPPHFARVDVARATGKLTVTEGALKSSIISELKGEAVCGIAGVTSFSDTFGADLRRAIPELKSVVVSYDADFRTNKAVRLGMAKIKQNLSDAGLEVLTRVWDASAGKGFDDVLAAAKGVA